MAEDFMTFVEREMKAAGYDAPPGFRAEPWYNPFGDCVEFKWENEAAVANRIDGILTFYHSVEDRKKVIGFKIKGVLALIKKAVELENADSGRLMIEAEQAEGQVRVSVSFLLLTALAGIQRCQADSNRVDAYLRANTRARDRMVSIAE